jgi:hypothetical protein
VAGAVGVVGYLIKKVVRRALMAARVAVAWRMVEVEDLMRLVWEAKL